jgi:hypothetical protein
MVARKRKKVQQIMTQSLGSYNASNSDENVLDGERYSYSHGGHFIIYIGYFLQKVMCGCRPD